MRINSVHIIAFGPFKNRTLELAPGMTVIVGGNESGKSTWHAAIYAALCGIRRGKGQPQQEDREFRDRHHPWGGNAWSVKANLELSNGRSIEITQDLDGVDRRAVDLGLGQRDVSDEIMFDGSPDASQWLGLDRRTFRATACVRQAEILDVLNRADALQEHLQRAAATGGADETAARALTILNDFHSEHVGTLHPNSQRPLRRAHLAIEQARNSLQAALYRHQKYLGQLENVKQLDQQGDQAARNLQVIDAAWALRNANEAARVAEQARRMAERLAELQPARAPTRVVSILLLVTAAIIGLAGIGVALLTTYRLAAIAALAVAAALVMIDAYIRRRAKRRGDESRSGSSRDDMDAQPSPSHEELVQNAKRKRQDAEKLMAGLPQHEVEAKAAEPRLDDQLTGARNRERQARDKAKLAQGELNSMLQSPAGVSSCEESLAAAQAQLGRLERLGTILTRTREFLEGAQDRVYREFAPHLAQTLCNWLPRITNDRYRDASVDPESLTVKVGVGGIGREAHLLSHGTREQVYLLLRMALVDFLTKIKPDEVSPLIFDDVTVQTDSIRTDAILNLLHEMSCGRQVIVFSQEEDVRRWAEQHLVNQQHDRIIRLNGPVPMAATSEP